MVKERLDFGSETAKVAFSNIRFGTVVTADIFHPVLGICRLALNKRIWVLWSIHLHWNAIFVAGSWGESSGFDEQQPSFSWQYALVSTRMSLAVWEMVWQVKALTIPLIAFLRPNGFPATRISQGATQDYWYFRGIIWHGPYNLVYDWRGWTTFRAQEMDSLLRRCRLSDIRSRSLRLRSMSGRRPQCGMSGSLKFSTRIH